MKAAQVTHTDDRRPDFVHALLCPRFPPVGGYGVEATLFTWFTRARQWYFSQPMLSFEAVTLGLALLVGLLVMPALIYFAGIAILQSYANGGLFALYGDYFKGLIEPRSSYWIVLIGPFVFLCVARLFRLILRKT